MQNLYGYLLLSALLVTPLWLFPTICNTCIPFVATTICNNLFYHVDFNFQAYLISITIYKQPVSYGNKMHLTPKAKQRIHILSFKKET